MLLNYNQFSEASTIHRLSSPFQGKILRIDEKWHKHFNSRLHQRRRSQSLNNTMNLTLRSETKPLTGTNYRRQSKSPNPQRSIISNEGKFQLSRNQIFHTIDTNAHQRNKTFFTAKKLPNYKPQNIIKTQRDQRQSKSKKYQNIQGLYFVQVQEKDRIKRRQINRNTSPTSNFRRGLRILKLKTNQKIKNKEIYTQKQAKANAESVKTQEYQKIVEIKNKKSLLKSLLHGTSIQPFIQTLKLERKFSQRQ